MEALAGVAPEGRAFCEQFRQIIAAGTGKEFTRAANENWVRRAGPIVQAFLHARFFLEMAVKCGAPIEGIPAQVRWSALLELYGTR